MLSESYKSSLGLSEITTKCKRLHLNLQMWALLHLFGLFSVVCIPFIRILLIRFKSNKIYSGSTLICSLFRPFFVPVPASAGRGSAGNRKWISVPLLSVPCSACRPVFLRRCRLQAGCGSAGNRKRISVPLNSSPIKLGQNRPKQTFLHSEVGHGSPTSSLKPLVIMRYTNIRYSTLLNEA